MNIQVLPLSDLDPFAYQKCLVPHEFFPKGTLPGSLARCKLSSGAEYICTIYSTTNQEPPYFCWLDDTVMVGTAKNTIESSLTSLEVLDRPVLQSAAKINLTFTINEKLFKIEHANRELLIDLAKEILQPYYLVNNSIIVLQELQELGITEIHVQSDDCNAFQLNEIKEAIVSNVKLQAIGEECHPCHIVAMEETQKELQQVIENMSIYDNLNWTVKPSLNVLLIGPPGSGKTSICMNFIVGNNANCNIIRPANILKQYPGETEAELRRIFDSIKTFIRHFRPNDPVVILIEDLDLICPVSNKNSTDSGNIMRISAQLISLLDDLCQSAESSRIIVIGTSSRLESITPTLRRPGRFGIEINIPALTEEKRAIMFDTMLERSFYGKNFRVNKDLLQKVAKQTQGCVAADLELLINSIGQDLLRSEITFENFTEILERSLKTIKPASFLGTDVKVFKTDDKFELIGGMEKLKRTLEVSVLSGLRHKSAFERFGLSLPKGILLYGPPGCAKTTIAKCLATEANMTFIPTSAAEVYSPYVGNSEKFISKIFDTARKNSPCLVFLDEIDSLVGKRTADSRSDVQTRILSTLLTEMDGIGAKLCSSGPTGGNSILVVAATNSPEMIDDALMRPGRFDKLIHVPAPDRDSRLQILRIHAQKMPFDTDVDLDKIADETELFSGADICNLCNEAAMHAFTQNINVEYITMEDFQSVLRNQKSSLTQAQTEWYSNFETSHKR